MWLRPPRFLSIGLVVVLLLITAGFCPVTATSGPQPQTLPALADPIDLELAGIGGGDYILELPETAYRIYFPGSLASAVKLMTREQVYEFFLAEMSYNAGEEYLDSPRPASAVIDAATVVYPDAFEDVDVEYRLTAQGIKEFFVLYARPPAPAGHLVDPTLDFTQIIDAGGLIMYVDGAPMPDEFTTDRSLEFVDEADGQTVFTLPAPYAVDAAGDVITIRYAVQTRGDEIRIHTQTPYAWLDDPARVYPVKIDPSVTLNAEYSVVLEGTTTWDTSWIGTGHFDDTQRTGIDFDTSSIPDTATITKVELKIYVDDEDGPLNNDVGNMTKKAYTYHVTDSDETGFNADVDGNQYLSNSSGFAGQGSYQTVELLSAAATDLENQLGADWFSVGWTGTTEADKKYRDAQTHSEANPPQLIVTYTDACTGNALTASPATVTEVTDGTCTVDKWANITNATAQDDALADIDDKKFDTGDVSARLDLTNFSFDLPTGATIDGVKVEIDRSAETGAAQDEIVRLLLNGSPDTTQNKALTSTAWPSSDTDTYQSYGGSTDKWGISSLSESDVENSGFGATLCVEATDKKAAYVDHVQITVYYSTALTSVSNSPSPNTEGDESTHTVAFTTASALPSDGKIVVTFPAGFNLLNVDNSDISSSTMDGSFTVSRSGQELTITRSGGTSQPAAAENIIIADVDNTGTVGTSYTVDVETQTSCDVTIDGPTTSSAFTVKGNSAMTNPATQVADQLDKTGDTQPTDIELVGFRITPTGENLTWTDLVVSLTYGGGMADADITNAEIYVDNGTVGTYESGTDTRVGAQSVNASGGSLTWNNVGGTVSAATNYLIIFDAGASLSADETVQASVTGANITATGATSSQSITTTGSVSNEPLHTVTPSIYPLTGVSNSPSPNTEGDESTHTVAFTTVSALPADGKIVITFPAGFNLLNVDNSDISSSTMDGNFTMSRSGQELTITRSGGSSQSAAAENIIIADVDNTGTVGTSYTVDVETRDSGDSTINGPTTSNSFTIKGNSALANPATQVTDKLTFTDGTQPTDVALVGFKITPTGENLTWTDLVISLTYGGGMADADITSARIYVDNGTVGTYDDGVDTQVGAQSVNAAGGSLTWDTVGGTIATATDYLIIFDAGASLSTDETVQASVTAANITVSGVTSGQSITTSGGVTNEPLHTVTGCGDGQFSYRRTLVIDYTKVGADNSGTLPATGFPVLVSLSGNWLKTTAVDAVNGRIEKANGWDIVFRGSDGITGLYHEIEEYDGTNGTLVAWVRIDSLSKAADTTFYIYYGNACVDADPSDPDNVWDSNFKGVWHLEEQVTDNQTSGTHDDSTDLNDGSQNNNGPIAGQIADGQDFDDSDDYVSVGDAGSGIKTVSFWLKADDITSRPVIEIDGTDKIEIDGSNNIVATSFPAATIYVDGSTASSAVTTSWHHVTITDSTGVNASALSIGGGISFADDFNRANSNTVGNGWNETDGGGQAQIRSNELFLDTDDHVNRPLVSHGFTEHSSGTIVWSFVINFERTGPEGDFEVWMQLGYGATMVDPGTSDTTGVAVNLKWGGTSNGFTNPEGFGYYDGASVTEIAVVSGETGYNPGGDATVTVTADLDTNTFDISVTGAGLISGTGSATGVAFDNNVDIDTVRIYTNEVGATNMGDMEIDDLIIIGYGSGGSDDLDGRIDEVRISDSVRDADWIKTAYNNQDDATPGAGNFIKSLGTEATAFATAIDLLSLSATGGDDAVQVDWETGSETGNLGFYLYRAASPAGPFVRITDQLIAGLNHSVEGRTYSYADTDVTTGQPYYYRLEDLDVDGQRTFHGPVGVDWDGIGAPEVADGDPDPAPWEPGGESGPVTVSATDEPVFKIMVTAEGIHRLTRDFLAGQGVALDKVDLSKVRLYQQAREVAIWVHDDNSDTVFDAADHITFYALPVAAEFAKYSADNVYWLTTGAGENPVKRMAEVDSAPDATALATGFDATVRSEQDQYYYPNAPGADELDRWLNSTWVVGADIAWPGAGDPITFTLDTPGATGSGTLTVALLGTYATDHEVDISVNGGPDQTFTWSGIAFYEAVIEDAALVDGLNTISLTCQTGLDALLIDWLAADYPRNFTADNDRLEFSSNSPERFLITNYTDGELLAFDITDPENVSRSINGQAAGSGPYSLEFTPPNGAAEARTYRVLSTDALLTPRAVSADAASSLTDAANGADYIIITHRNLGWDGAGNQYAWLTDLLAHRQAQGHRVMAVNLTDVYDEFAFGLATPAAIQDFLAYAVGFWAAPAPQYVLLVGDATYDYKDNWGNGTTDDVPSYTIYTEEAGETVTDEWYVLTSGGDVIPDLYIGRLPAATAAEAQVMASKIISYESAVNTKTWQKNIVLAADNRTRDEETVFESMNDDAADLLPAALQPPFRAYLEDYGTAAALKTDLIARIDSGSLLLNYSGHASVQVWAAENIFDSGDVAGLANAGRYPFIVNMSCLSGYFAYPAAWNFPSLSEVLLRAADKGAVAMLVPTGQTNPKDQYEFNTALFEAIITSDIRQVGAAVGRAKQSLLQDNPQQTEVSRTFLLFGDPAMVLQVHLPLRPGGLTAELSASSSVALEWDSALDANGGAVAGYNIYRGAWANGPWTQLNGTTLVDTVYSDSDLTAGAAYYYVVTALDTDGDESVYSETASVVLTDSDGDGLYDLLEAAGCTDVNLSDSDSDGLSDGTEDANRNGTLDAGETDPCEADSDADTLPDGWETANGFNALNGSGDDGADADPDGDGWTNYQEYLSCTDPLDTGSVPAAPTVPALYYPANGSETTTLEPWLSVSNAADADCQAVRYVFELYADAALTILVDATAAEGIAEADNTTAWRPGSVLTENAHYYWRARAFDSLASSDWLATATFFVNTTAEAPSTPAVSAPPDGSEVSLRRPSLEVVNAADADGDPLTYAFRVFADESLTTLVDSQNTVAEGAGATTTWQVTAELDDNTDYWWTVQTTDDDDLTGDWSAPTRFFVNTDNDTPSTPPGGSPAIGAEVTTTTPLLAVVHATDADLDALSYFFEIDTAATFDSIGLEQSDELTEQAGVSTSWAPDELTDNTTYYWRVRAFDGGAYGPWHNASFFVNTANDLPGAPTVDHPGDASEVTTRQPTLTVKAALDADLDTLVYDFELYEDAEMTAPVTDVAGAGPVWQVDQILDDNRTYFWRVRAVDAHAAPGPWSTQVSFFVNTANDTPGTPVLNNPVSGGVATSLNPTLSVFNTDDTDQDALTYAFELYADADLSQLVSAAIVAEGQLITSWTVSAALDDQGIYYWRARADDGQQTGAWMPTAVLEIQEDGTDTAYEIVTRQPVFAAASVRQTVNVSAVDNPIYNTMVELPPGALPRDCSINIGPVTNPPALPRGTRKIGPVIEFGPSGITFNVPVLLRLPYTAAALNQARVANPVELTVYWYDTSILTWVPVEIESIDTVNQLIDIRTDHFSMYTIGAAVADASGGGGGGGSCFIAAAHRAESIFFVGNWSEIGICGLLALVGLLWLGKRKKRR